MKDLSRKHHRTLERVFAHPPTANLREKQLDALLEALGMEVRYGKSDRIIVRIGDATIVHHADKGSMVDKAHIARVREALRAAGIEPGKK